MDVKYRVNEWTEEYGVFFRKLSHMKSVSGSQRLRRRWSWRSPLSLSLQFSPFFKILFLFLHLLTPCNQASYTGYITLLTFHCRFFSPPPSSASKQKQKEQRKEPKMSRQPPARRRVIMDSDEELGQKGNSGDSEAIRVSSWFTIKYLVFVSLLEV